MRTCRSFRHPIPREIDRYLLEPSTLIHILSKNEGARILLAGLIAPPDIRH
jgi:hypothetical protein